MLKKTKIGLIVIASVLCFGVTQAAPAAKLQAALSAAKKNKRDGQLLFVATLTGSSLKYLKGREYQLRVKQKQMKSLLAFSDRPARISFEIKPARFFQLAHQVRGVFHNDPPNLVLVFKGGSNATFEIGHYKIEKGAAILNLKHIGKKKVPNTYTGKMILFVDGSCADANEAAIRAELEPDPDGNYPGYTESSAEPDDPNGLMDG